MLRNKHHKLGTYTPSCKQNGSFEDIQCFEGECWCVSPTGEEILNTRDLKHTIPNCQGKVHAIFIPLINMI